MMEVILPQKDDVTKQSKSWPQTTDTTPSMAMSIHHTIHGDEYDTHLSITELGILVLAIYLLPHSLAWHGDVWDDLR